MRQGAPDVFDVDFSREIGDGVVPPALEAAARRAVSACHEEAIFFIETDNSEGPA